AATTYNCSMSNTCSSAASGIEARSTARPMSAAIKTGRRRRRSTHAPASRPTTRTGAVLIATSRPICIGVAFSTKTAARGSAVPLAAGPVQPGRALDDEAIGLFRDGGAQAPKLPHRGGDAVRLLDAQLRCVAHDCAAVRLRGHQRQQGQLVEQARDQGTADLR